MGQAQPLPNMAIPKLTCYQPSAMPSSLEKDSNLTTQEVRELGATAVLPKGESEPPSQNRESASGANYQGTVGLLGLYH